MSHRSGSTASGEEFDYLVAVINEKVKQDDHFSIKSASRRSCEAINYYIQKHTGCRCSIKSRLFMSFFYSSLSPVLGVARPMRSLMVLFVLRVHGYQFYHCYFRRMNDA
jgi:hypothetical protein